MGAKTWMLVHADGDAKTILKSGPPLDREVTDELVERMFPDFVLQHDQDSDLSYTNPPDDTIFAGCFPGLTVVAASEFGIDYPSRLNPEFLSFFSRGTLVLHAMHSVVDWFAFAVWKDGKLERSLSLSPDSGVLEDIGSKLDFELPYWAGEHPLFGPEEEDDGDYPFVFHPLDLGEAALLHFFGYQIEGVIDPDQLEAENIPLAGYKRSRPPNSSRPWWKFWK